MKIFEELYQQHYLLVYHLSYKIVNNNEEAEDIVQETFLKLHSELSKNTEIQYPKTWLCRVAINRATNFVNRKKEISPFEEADLASLSEPDYSKAAIDENTKTEVIYKALDYMPLGSQPLKNGKIAILGHVPMGNASKQILSIYDTNTRKQKTLSSLTTSYAKANESRIVVNPIEYTAKDGSKQKGPTISISLPFNDPFISRERMAADSKGNLIVGYPIQGKIAVYATDGTKIREFKVDMPHEAISKEDMEGYYQKAKKQLDEMEKSINIENAEYKKQYIAQYRSQLEKFRDPTNYSQGLPYFAEMIIDSDDNILLFNFTKEAGSNKFDVITYTNNGKKIGSSSFKSDKYKLSIAPQVFIFNKGQIIGYQELSNSSGNNMRLVKFNLN